MTSHDPVPQRGTEHTERYAQGVYYDHATCECGQPIVRIFLSGGHLGAWLHEPTASLMTADA